MEVVGHQLGCLCHQPPIGLDQFLVGVGADVSTEQGDGFIGDRLDIGRVARRQADQVSKRDAGLDEIAGSSDQANRIGVKSVATIMSCGRQ